MKKTLTKIVTLILTLSLLLGVVSTTVFAASASEGGAGASEETIGGSLTTGWFDISYDENGITVLLTPSMEELSGINREELEAVLGMLIEAIKEQVIFDLKDELIGGSDDTSDPVVQNTEKTSAEKVFEQAFNAYVEEKYGAATSENYVEFLKSLVGDNASAAVDELATYVCDLLTTFVASGAIEVEDLPAAEDIEDNVITIFENELNARISEEANRYVQLYLSNLRDSSVAINSDVKALIDEYVTFFVKQEVEDFIDSGFKAPNSTDDVDRIVAEYITEEIHDQVDAWLNAYASGDEVSSDVLALIEAEITIWVEELADAYINDSVPADNPIYAEYSGKLDAIVDENLLLLIVDYLSGKTVDAGVASAIEETLDNEAPGYIYDLYWEHRTNGSLGDGFWADIHAQFKTAFVNNAVAAAAPGLEDLTRTQAEQYFEETDAVTLKTDFASNGIDVQVKDEIKSTVAGYTVSEWKAVWDELTEDEHEDVVDIVEETDEFKAILPEVVKNNWLAKTDDALQNRRNAIAFVISTATYEDILADVIDDAEHDPEYVSVIEAKVNSYLEDAIALLSEVVSQLDENDYASLSAAIKTVCDNKLDSIKDEAFIVALGKNEAEVRYAIIDVAIPALLLKYTETVEGFKVKLPEFSIKDIFKLVKNISLDDYALFVDGAFDVEAIKTFIFDLPTFEDIADMSNREMQLSYNISIETTVGTSDFGLSVVLTDGYNVIRKYAGLVADYLDFDMNEEGVIVFDLTVPDGFAELVLKAAKSDKVPDEIKKKIFSMFTTTPGDVHAFINNTTFEEFLDLLDYIDFEGLMDIEFLSRFEKLDGLTAEQVKAKLREYENYFNKFVQLVNKIYGKLPESLKDKNVMDLYDGNGSFIHSGEYSVDIEKLITSISPRYAALIASFMSDPVVNASIDISVSFEKINSVEFVIEGETHKKGLLPAGADLHYFADITKFGLFPVVAWRDIDGNIYTEMPDEDIVLYAELNKTFGLTAAIQSSVEKTYDGEATELRVVLDYETLPANIIPSYQWYKDGVAINGAILSSISVKNVADSGSYYCVVTLNSESEKLSDIPTNVCTVAISKAELDLTKYTWKPTELIYNGEAQSVYLVDADGNILTFGVTYVNDDTYTNVATLAGSYIASVIIDTDNFNVTGAVQNYSWTIQKATVNLDDYTWSEGKFTYDGEAHSVVLVSKADSKVELRDGVIYVIDETYTNVAVNAGAYKAKVVLVDTDNYEFIGTNKSEYDWEIQKATYDLTTFSFTDKTVVYDGKLHTIVITGTLPEGVTVSYSSSGYTNPGTYTITATFEYDTENYVALSDLTATLRILGLVKDHVIRDSKGETLVEVTALNGVVELYNINMKDLSAQYYYLEADEIFGEGKVGYVGSAYDIHFAENGTVQPVQDTFTVKLRIPDHMIGLADDVMKVVYIDENGNLQDMMATRQDGYIVFTTTHFSIYAITETADAPIPPTVPDYSWIWILVAVLLALIIVAIIVLIVIKKRKGNGDDEPTAPEAAPVVDNTAEEAPAEEAPAEEIPVEETPEA